MNKCEWCRSESFTEKGLILQVRLAEDALLHHTTPPLRAPLTMDTREEEVVGAVLGSARRMGGSIGMGVVGRKMGPPRLARKKCPHPHTVTSA